jgi:pimeloyl-ACP methyl ester carboxylesterase
LVLVDGALREMASAPGATWPAVRRDLAPPRLTGLTIEQLIRRLTAPGRTWALDEHAVQAVIGSFAIDARGRIRPHLTRPRHLALLRTIWDYRLYQAYPQLSCPVLLLPARPPAPRSEAEASRLVEKRKGVALAQKTIQDVRVSWMRDTIHDVPLQRPRALAKRILEFAASGCSA